MADREKVRRKLKVSGGTKENCGVPQKIGLDPLTARSPGGGLPITQLIRLPIRRFEKKRAVDDRLPSVRAGICKRKAPAGAGRGLQNETRWIGRLFGGGLVDRDAGLLEVSLQLLLLEHFADDVAAADELALDVELRQRRPVGIGLDAVAQFGIFQHVDAP